MPLNKVTITGTFDDGSGTALSGTAVFTPSQTVYFNGIPVVSASNPVSVAITGGALQSCQLVATDNSGVEFLSQTGFWFWTVAITLNGVNQPGFSFFLPHSPSTIDLYTLANTTAGGGGSVNFPITIAEGGTGQTTASTALAALGGVALGGDLGGSSSSPTVAKIQGTTIAAPSGGGTAFLNALGNWATAGGVSSLTFTYGSTGAVPSSGTYTAGTIAVDQNNITRVCTVSGTPGTWARVYAQPEDFYVFDYGALGNGRLVGDAAMTASAATLTSATANFTSGDVGKNIVVNGALGNSQPPLYTTITGFTNSTTVTLGANATNTISSAPAFYASDDSGAIVNAINAANTFAQANQWKARILFQAKAYGLATLTTTVAGGSLASQNALVPIPYPNVNGTTRKLNIELAGVGESGEEQYFDSTIPNMTGTALVATVAASGTNPSVIGAPNASTNLSGTWANVKVTIRGITVWCGWNPGWVAFDLRECASCWVDNAGAQIIASVVAGQSPLLTVPPTNGNGIGFLFPSNNDNGAGRIVIEGYYYAVQIAPRTTINKLLTFVNNTTVLVKTVGSTVTHGAWIGYWSCNACTTAIAPQNANGTTPLVVEFFDASSITTTLNDPTGSITGLLNWFNAAGGAPAVTAGFTMRIVNLNQLPGPVSSPTAPPATGVAWQNTYWRDAEVTASLTGGTMTALSVDGVDQHIPSGCVLWKFTVPSGHSYTPTYTGTLAHDVTVI